MLAWNSSRLRRRARARCPTRCPFAIAASGPAFAGYLFDAIRRQPYPGLCACIAANAAAAQDGRRGHYEERTTQVQWPAKHLALTQGD